MININVIVKKKKKRSFTCRPVSNVSFVKHRYALQIHAERFGFLHINGLETFPVAESVDGGVLVVNSTAWDTEERGGAFS